MQNELTFGQLGRELRSGSSRFLKRRRNIVGLALFSSAVLGGVALYQIGIVKKLPGPRWRGCDAEKVNGSAQAYSILAIPDALLGLTSYGVTACLAGMGPENRWRTHPLIPIGMGVKLVADAALAGKLTVDACRKYRSVSVWSLLAAAATFAALRLAIPEARAALSCLTGTHPRLCLYLYGPDRNTRSRMAPFNGTRPRWSWSKSLRAAKQGWATATRTFPPHT